MPPVRFILGLAGVGKTTRIVREIADELERDPLGEPIYLLVPDQATLLYERLAARATRSGGYVRLTVITFRQLVEMLLAEEGGTAIPEVTPLGRRILIGRLLRRHEGDLQFYRSSARQPGLADRLDEAFAEIEHSGTSPDDLDYLAADIELQSPRSPLPAKLRDVRLLLREYDKLLGSERLDQHRRLRQALRAAEQSGRLSKARLYVDAFHDFTRTERELLLAVARRGCATTIALTLDPADATPARRDAVLEDDHPFREPTHAFRRLERALRESRVPVDRVVEERPHRFRSNDLLHLQKNFPLARPGKTTADGGIRLVEAPDRRAEVDTAARQILDWLADGMRLRDILVLARDVSDYQRHIEASFAEHRIPFFIDRRQPASHHPLIRTVRSLMQVALSRWGVDAVLELLKAGLLGVEDDAIDAVENYLLAHHIRGDEAWAGHWTFRTRRAEDDEAEQFLFKENARINEVRGLVWDGLQPLLDCDDHNTCTAARWCTQLCTAMDKLGVNASLAARVREAEEAGDPEAAARHHEVWTEFTELLDQLAAVLADEMLSLREFAEVVDVALERFAFAIAPPTIDQVLVGGVERTRSGPVQACVVLGLSEGLFPRRREEASALSDDDRRILDRRRVELKADSRTSQFDEQFLAYLALTRASRHLLVTRPLTSDEGPRALAPSLFWTQLRAAFHGLPVESLADAPTGADIATARQLAEATIAWHRDPADAGQASTIRQLAGYAERSPALAPLRDTIGRAQRYRNDATISSDIAKALFPSPIQASATRLETFAACPYQHFAKHTLRLAPRADAQVTQLDLGLVYHRALDKLIRGAIDERRDLTQPLPELAERLKILGGEAAREVRGEVMLTPGRNAHLMAGMRRTLHDLVEAQRLALSLGRFRPRHTELAFGFEDGPPPLRIRTPGGRDAEIRGKIDRVDMVDLADRVAASVIDYKSGAKTADFNRIYFGLSLQLMTYLLVLGALGETLASGKPIVPAAAFYVKLLRGVMSVDHPDDAAAPPEEDYFLTADSRARGVIHEDFVDALDAVTSARSKAYSIWKTSKPIKMRRNDVLDRDTFDALVKWTRRKVGQLVDQIAAGEIAVKPFRLKTSTPCSNCPYRSLCRLDLAFNDYEWLEGDRGRLAAIVHEAAGIGEAS